MTTRGTAHRPTGDGFSARRAATVVLAVLSVSLTLALALFYVPEMQWWGRRRAFLLVASPAKGLASSVERFKGQTGSYPKTVAEYEALANDFGYSYVVLIREGASRLGVRLETTHIPTGAGEAAERALLVMTGPGGSVAILQGGCVRISTRLAPQKDMRPEWLEVAGPEQ